MALSSSSRRFLVFLVVGGGLIAGGLYLTGQYLDPSCAVPDTAGEPVEFTIPSGASAADVGRLLEEREVTCSASAFRRAAQDAGIDGSLVAGDYALTVGMDLEDVVTALGDGPADPDTFRFTVPEGLTVAQTLERMAESTPYTVDDYRAVLEERRRANDNADGLLRLPDFVPPLASFGPDVREPYEGLLFPLTYEFPEAASALDVLQRMVDQLATVVAELPANEVQAFEEEGFDLYDALVIASLVEREARVGDERDTIAAVVRNRLADGQLLQVDASVLYGQGDPAAGAAAVDTSFTSPYNTYQVAGLPPTPISGFRGSLVRSAITPADVDFTYYVVSPDCDGSHNFATTLDEHNANVRAYREAGRCSG